jgi:hypothetical protein
MDTNLHSVGLTNQAASLIKGLALLERVERAVDLKVEETLPGTFRVGDRAVQYYETLDLWTCDCPDFIYRRMPLCKHMIAVLKSGLVDPESGQPASFHPPF